MAKAKAEAKKKAPTKTAAKASSKKPKSTRAERRALRTEEILTTAQQLIEEGGLAALTTTELARRNGAALGALYRFFPNKQAVIAALQAQAMAQLKDELTAARDRARALPLSSPAKLWAPIIALADVWFAEAARHPARFRLIDEILSSPQIVYADADARRLEEGAQALLGLVRSCVDDVVVGGFGGGTSAAVRRFPFALWAALHGVSHFTKRDRIVEADHRAASVAASLLVLLLKGLGAADDDLSAAFAAVGPQALVP